MKDPKDIAAEAPGGFSAPCRSCGARILWVTFPKSGKRAPVDAAVSRVLKVKDGLVLEIVEGHTSHFATCPHADKWRKSP